MFVVFLSIADEDLSAIALAEADVIFIAGN
jgi:hypothetical protein